MSGTVSASSKAVPPAPDLVATLVNPDRKAGIGKYQYSPDGKRLLVADYPTGVVQFFDVEPQKEIRRIETPKGFRSALNSHQTSVSSSKPS